MMITRIVLLVSSLVAMAALAVGYGANGLWIGVLAILAIDALWLVGWWRGWGWTASVGLLLFTGAAAVGLLKSVGAGWMLLGVVAALSTWDLARFARHLERAERIENARAMEWRHLQRLLLVDGLGLLLGAAALSVRVQFGFGTVFILALLAVLSLSQVFGLLRRQGVDRDADLG